MEYGASEPVMDQPHLEITIKAEVEEAAPSTAYIDNDADVNHLKQEPGLVQCVESEPPPLVQEESLEDSRQATTVEHRASECVKEQSHTEINIKKEMEEAARSAAYIDNEIDLNHLKQEPGLVHLVKSEPALLVKEEILKDPRQGYKEPLKTVCSVHLMRLDTFHCELCDAVYVEKRRLLQHVQTVHRSHPQAPLFVKFHKTNKQQATDSSSKCYRCEKCLYVLKSEANLNQHIRIVHGTESHKCAQCNKEFKRKSYLSQHVQNTHSKIQYECDICKKIYKSRRNLCHHISKTHRNRSAGKQPQRYRCDKCLKAFKSNYLRNRHWNRIHGSESYKCTQCNKEFKCKSYLINHVRYIHGKERYECDICKKIYKNKKSIHRHIVGYHSHSISQVSDRKNRNYHCDKCSKTFVFKSGLKLHCQIMHETEYHKCPKCNREFKCMTYLRTHIKNMHGNQPYECDICKKIFKNKKSIRHHIMGYHSLLVSDLRESCTREVHDSHPIVSETSAVINTDTQQHYVSDVKLESADAELDLGTVVFQHKDSNYRPLKEELQFD